MKKEQQKGTKSKETKLNTLFIVNICELDN